MYVQTRLSSFRAATNINLPSSPALTPEIIELIRNKRGCFKWLPVVHMSDIQFGAIWWIVASVLTVLYPIFPLIALYEDFWDEERVVPRGADVAAYGFLTFMGICYTLGSYLFHRAVIVPAKASLFTLHHIHTDELHAMWWFFIGTLCSVPVCAIYTFYNQELGQYGLALALALIVSLALELATFATYPPQDIDADHVEYMSPYFNKCLSNSPELHKHLANDWLIAMWMFFYGSVFAVGCSFALLMYYADQADKRRCYDYTAGLVDCIIFLVGCFYVTAGSYVSVTRKDLLITMEENAPAEEVVPGEELELRSTNMDQNPVMAAEVPESDEEEERIELNMESREDEELGLAAAAPPALISGRRSEAKPEPVQEDIDDIPEPSAPHRVQTSLAVRAPAQEYAQAQEHKL